MPDPMFDAKLPDSEILARIGTVSAEWSWLESLTHEFLVKICSADPGAMYVITQSASHSSVMKWLATLVEIKVKPLDAQDVIINLFKDIDLAREDRNTVVHGLWNAAKEAGFAHVHTLKWTRSEVAKVEMWSLADFDELIEHINMLQRMMGNLMIKMGFLRIEER